MPLITIMLWLPGGGFLATIVRSVHGPTGPSRDATHATNRSYRVFRSYGGKTISIAGFNGPSIRRPQLTNVAVQIDSRWAR